MKNSLRYKCLVDYSFKYQDYEFVSIKQKHIESIRVWRNYQKEILRQKKNINTNEQLAYYKDTILKSYKLKYPNDILLMIKHKEEIIGYGGLVHISWLNQRSEISFLLDNKIDRNSIIFQKHFSSFLALTKNLAFDKLKLNKLTTDAYFFRRKMIKNLEKNGFKKICINKQHYIKDNKFIDSVTHAFFNKQK